jgi:hypothetical protein
LATRQFGNRQIWSCGTVVASDTVVPNDIRVATDTATVPDTAVPGGAAAAGDAGHPLYFWPDADLALDQLAAADPTGLYAAVVRVLRRLSADPYSRRLGTTLFRTPELGGICATPVRVDDWYVFWQRGREPGALEIVLIQQLPVGQPA